MILASFFHPIESIGMIQRVNNFMILVLTRVASVDTFPIVVTGNVLVINKSAAA